MYWCKFIHSQYYVGQLLDVQILVDPPGIRHQASSSLNLTCTVSRLASAPLTYQWTSNCNGNCFVLHNEDSTIFSNALHSIDSGNHTCSVTDALGNIGTAMTEIVVHGKFKKVKCCTDK